MTDPMDRLPADYGSDRHGHVETHGAPEGVFPPDRLVDQMLATACPDCKPNLILDWVDPEVPITDPPNDWVDVHGQRWHVTVAHDDGCPTLTKIEQEGQTDGGR